MDMEKYLVSSQHGVAREINVFQKELRCSMENSVSDLFFVQNEEASKKYAIIQSFVKVNQ